MTHQPAELMRVLDEKYISNPVIWHEARMTGSLVVEGAPLRDATGALDRELILRVIANGVAQITRFRMRARGMPLGLTAPLWVEADVEAEYHVRFAADRIGPELDDMEILAGLGNGVMSTERPMWNVLVAELDSGEVCFTVHGHHAMGDGFFALKVMEAFSSAVPHEPDFSFDELRRGDHRPLVVVLVEASQLWLTQFPLWRAAWTEYWRKPFLKRLKRWGGRLLRPSRFRASGRNGLPAHLAQRNHRVIELELRSVKKRARELGGSVSDLLVSAMLVAVEQCVPGDSEPAISVPIARRESVVNGQGNHISMARVTAPRGARLPEIVPLCRAAVLSAVDEGATAGALGWVSSGYASYLPWHVRRRFFGLARVESLTFWPTITPDESISALAVSYAGRLRVAVIANREVDLDGAIAILVDSMSESIQELHEEH